MPRITRKKKDDLDISAVIDDAAVIDAEMKNLEKKLKPMKAAIKLYIENNYTQDQIKDGFILSGKTSSLEIIGCEEREEIRPEDALLCLKSVVLALVGLMWFL